MHGNCPPFSTTSYSYAFPDEAFPFSVMAFSHAEPINPHRHDFHELVMVMAGTAIHHVGTASYTVSSGDLFLIPPGLFHGYSDCQEYCYFNLLVDFRKSRIPLFDLETTGAWRFLSQEMPRHFTAGEECHYRLQADALGRCCTAVEELLALQIHLAQGRHFALAVGFLNFLGMICELGIPASRPALEAGSTAGTRGFASLARHFSFATGKTMPIAEICRRMKVSRATLFRHFRRECGMSPLEYQRNCRLHHAALLLLHSNQQIDSIARQCGFATMAHFSSMFRKRYGLSPLHYRQKGPKSPHEAPDTGR